MELGVAVFPADFAMRPDDRARAVEQRGFESLLFAEHTHLPATPTTQAMIEAALEPEPIPPYAHTHDLFVALAFAAAATTRLLVGSGVCLVLQRKPIATAKAVASLDVLSGGRVLVGVGAGWVPEQTAHHGVVVSERWSVMNERVKAMRRIWTQDEAEFHGDYVDFGSIWSWPKPHQRPHPPILVGGEGKGAAPRCRLWRRVDAGRARTGRNAG